MTEPWVEWLSIVSRPVRFFRPSQKLERVELIEVSEAHKSPMKRDKPEEIVALLRQIEVGIASGKSTPQACKEAEINTQTNCRWRKQYGGLKSE